MGYLYNDAINKEKRRALRNNSTNAERVLWSILRNKQIDGLRCLRQYSVGPYIVDFYYPKQRLAIELDGGQHNEDHGQQYDQHRTNYLVQQDIRVIRFWNNEVLGNKEAVWEKIQHTLKETHS